MSIFHNNLTFGKESLEDLLFVHEDLRHLDNGASR